MRAIRRLIPTILSVLACCAASAESPNETVLVQAGSAWRYWDHEFAPESDWTQVEYNDEGWESGPAPLGYGDGDEATVIEYGPNASDKNPAAYFRTWFEAADTETIFYLALRLQRDDGAVIYLNGTELYRDNMPGGSIDFETLALRNLSGSEEREYIGPVLLPADALVTGDNLIAVEVHQQFLTSADMSFDMALAGVHDAGANLPPVARMIQPAEGSVYFTPASIELTAELADDTGYIEEVEYYINDQPAGVALESPFTLVWTIDAPGEYEAHAIAVDNLGLAGESTSVRFSLIEPVPLEVLSMEPVPGAVTNLQTIEILMSMPVAGLEAFDLSMNGRPAHRLESAGNTHLFYFPPPAEGPVEVQWAEGHGIRSRARPVQYFDPGQGGLSWTYEYIDRTSPQIARITPSPGATIGSLDRIEIEFDEPILGIFSDSLIVNGNEAAVISGRGGGPYVFEFEPVLESGSVEIRWNSDRLPFDSARSPNRYEATTWNYIIGPEMEEPAVLINELHYHPETNDVRDEFIELYNRSSTPASLLGWRFSDGVDFEFPDAVLPARGYLVVAADPDWLAARRPDIPNLVGGWDGKLSDGGERVALSNAKGELVDEVEYADEGDWAKRQVGPDDYGYRGWIWNKPHDGDGPSLELAQPGLSNGFGQNWRASLVSGGTPGYENSVLFQNGPPLIVGVAHHPPIPSPLDSVAVQARVIDEGSEPAWVRLRYRIDSLPAGSFKELPMHDDGLHRDGKADDGLYGAVMPALPSRTVVEFYVEAEDMEGKRRTWPDSVLDPSGEDVGQRANALYQVREGGLDESGSSCRIIMTAEENQRLQNIADRGFGAPSDAQMNAVFISEDATGVEVRYLAGVRNRGHGSRGREPSNYRVNFRSDDRWKGVTRININGQYTYLQVIGSLLALKSGVAGADSRPVRVRVNEIDMSRTGATSRTYGFFAMNQVLDEDFTEARFPLNPDGNLYRGLRDAQPADLEYRGVDPEAYANSYFKQSNETESDWADLIELTRVLSESTDEEYAEAASQAADVDQWMNYLAVMVLLNTRETSPHTGYGDDYSIYRGTRDNRFYFLFYDLDSILGQGDGAGTPEASILGRTNQNVFSAAGLSVFDRLMKHPKFVPLFYRHLLRHIDHAFHPSQFDPFIEQHLRGWVPSSTRESLKDWNRRRNDALRAIIPVELVVQPALPFIDGAYLALESSIRMEGRSHASRTRQVTVDGKTVEWMAWTASWTAAQLELQPGFNSLLVQAWDEQDLEFESREIPVIFNAPDTEEGGENESGGGLADAMTQTIQEAAGEQAGSAPNVSSAGIRINEILAWSQAVLDDEGRAADYIELYNGGVERVELSGMSLSDDPGNIRKWIFPNDAALAPGDYLLLTPEGGSYGGTPSIRVDFALSREGEVLTLYDRPENSYRRVDSIQFGAQLADHSLGRDENNRWGLSAPTPGAFNEMAPVGNNQGIRINEWFAVGGGFAAREDYIELYNPDEQIVNAGGLHLTDETIGNPFRQRIHSYTFIDAHGFLTFDRGAARGASTRLEFGLAAEQGMIGLTDERGRIVDQVLYGPSRFFQSQGRVPDGAFAVYSLDASTPGSANAAPWIALGTEPVNPIRINEVMASADEGDWVELTNAGQAGFSLSGLALAASSNAAVEWRFSQAAWLEPGRLFVVDLSGNPEIGLRAEGDAVYLIDHGSGAPVVVDSVRFGRQVPNYTIGRDFMLNGRWRLNTPTPGLPNLPADPGNARSARVNEWMAQTGAGDDWFELYNSESRPIDLSGVLLMDQSGLALAVRIPDLTFLGVGEAGFVVYRANGTNDPHEFQTGFQLDADGDSIRILTGDGAWIDEVRFGPQINNVSEGRYPDGMDRIVSMGTAPTPGFSNQAGLDIADSDQDGMPDEWERKFGLDPFNAEDAVQDLDGDGFDNRREYLAGVDPWDAFDFPRVEGIETQGRIVFLSVPVRPGRRYEVEYSDTANINDWRALKIVSDVRVAETVRIADEMPVETKRRFYRVKVLY